MRRGELSAVIIGAALALSGCADEAGPLTLGDADAPSGEPTFETADCTPPADVYVWSPEDYESVSGGLAVGARTDGVDLIVSAEGWAVGYESDALDRIGFDHALPAGSDLRLDEGGQSYEIAVWSISEGPGPGLEPPLVGHVERWAFDPRAGTLGLVPGSPEATVGLDLRPRIFDAGFAAEGAFVLIGDHNGQELVLQTVGRPTPWRSPTNGVPVVVVASAEAGVVAHRTEGRPDLSIVPFDFRRGEPVGPPWSASACVEGSRPLTRGPPIQILAVDGDTVIVSTCPGSTVAQRHASDGRLVAERRWPGASTAAARATFDAAGHLVVARWPAEDASPTVELLRPDDLTPARAAVTVPRDADYPTRGSELVVTARPTGAGEVFVGYSYVIGHGAGEVELARLRLCARS